MQILPENLFTEKTNEGETSRVWSKSLFWIKTSHVKIIQVLRFKSHSPVKCLHQYAVGKNPVIVTTKSYTSGLSQVLGNNIT